MIGTVVNIISIALTVIGALTILLNVLFGFLGKNSKALSKLCIVTISMIVALIFSKLIAQLAAGKLWPTISKMVGGETLSELEAVVPSFPSIATALTVMMVSPIVFLLVFGIVRFILSLTVKRIFTKLFDLVPFFKKKRHYLGPIVGLVTGLLILVVYFVPLSGFIGVIDDAMEAVDAGKTATAVVDGIEGSPTVKVTSSIGSKLMFNGLTKVKIAGQKTNMTKEVKGIVGMVAGVKDITGGKEFSQFGPEESASIRGISDSFGHSVIVPTLAADVLSSAAGAWSDGDEFMGAKAPSMGDAFDNFAKDLFGILETTNYDTVRQDVDCITFIFCQFIDYGVFASNEGQDMLTAMSQEGLISGIVEKLYEYDRMAALIPSITNVGFYMLSDALGIPADNQQVYNELMADIAEEVAKAQQVDGDLNAKAEALKAGLVAAYANSGVDIPEETVAIIAPGLLGYFNGELEINPDDVSSFYDAIDKSLAEKTPGETGVAFGGAVMIAGVIPSDIIEAITDHLVYGESEIKALEGYDMVATYVPNVENLAKVRKLASSETMETSKVTLAQLKVSSSDIPTDVATKLQDAQNIEKLIVKMTELKDVDTSSIENVVGQIGGMLDSMSGMSTIGHDKTKDFLAAVLQSETVSSATGWTPGEAADISGKLSENAQKGEGGYEQIMNGVGNGVAYINVALDETKTIEERREALHDLLVNLDAGTVDSVNSVLTPSLLSKYGASEKDHTTTYAIDATKIVLDNMLAAKESGMSEAQYLEEVEAIDYLMMIALSNTKTTSKDFFGENGSTGSTSDQIIAKVVDSVVVSNSLIDFCYDGETLKDNPLGVKTNNETEIQQFKADLEQCYNSKIGGFTAGSEEARHFTKTINAFATLMDIDPIA